MILQQIAVSLIELESHKMIWNNKCTKYPSQENFCKAINYPQIQTILIINNTNKL